MGQSNGRLEENANYSVRPSPSGSGRPGSTTAAVAVPQVVPSSSAPAMPPAQVFARAGSQVPHKSTAIIPGWSKTFSSQCLGIECQRISQPQRNPSAKESVGIMELEVMKFVAYCGGLTVRIKIDESNGGPPQDIAWGLVALKSMSNAPNGINDARGQVVGPAAASSSGRIPGRPQGFTINPPPTNLTPINGLAYSKPPAGHSIPIDNHVRKSMNAICSAQLVRAATKNDILSIELAPREDGQPAINVTMSMNGFVVYQCALPCSCISGLQIYPYFTVPVGMTHALYEALTPSSLFTWYSPTSATADLQMADLDTCVKYNTSLTSHPNSISEFHGATCFTTGRHRWTIQLDNMAPHPGFVFVGLVTSEPPKQPSATVLGNLLAAPGQSLPIMDHIATGDESSTSSTPKNKWGVWVRLPGAGHNPQQNTPLVPPQDGVILRVESTSSHCCITVDLDLNQGFAKFFRNGHVLGHALTGLSGHISPCLAFLQGNNQHLQAGLVNITKLSMLDLDWNTSACSADLKINNKSIAKVSEVFGDYSTVLATKGFISGVHLWLVKINHLSEPDSIFIGVCRGCMPLDQDPQDLRDRTYYLSNGVIRVGGRRVATNAANFTKGDIVGVVLDADQGEIVFLRNGLEQGRARGIRGRLYPFISFDSEGDNIVLLGSYTLNLNRIPRQLSDMEWDTLGHTADIELSSNCLTASKTQSLGPSTVKGTILYNGTGVHQFNVILDSLGPDGVWVGVAAPDMDESKVVGDVGCGWALHSDGDKRLHGREEEFTSAFSNGDVLTVGLDLGRGLVKFLRNGVPLGCAFTGVTGPLVAVVTLASEESKVTIQNRPTVLNKGEYTGELRWDEVKAGRDLHVIDGLTITKMSNEGGDYATVLGTLSLASGQHTWNIYVNHVEDSNLFVGVTVGGHDLNADPQEMKSRTYYLSNGTIRVAGKLVTRCAEPYAEGDLVTVQLDMDKRHIGFLKNGVLQGAGDSVPDEVWPYVSLDNIMDSITLHSSYMFADLANSLKWNPAISGRYVAISVDGQTATLTPQANTSQFGQATVMGVREYSRSEVHAWMIKLDIPTMSSGMNFVVGVCPPSMDSSRSLGEDGCGIGLDYYGYIYINGKYFHVSNIANWQQHAKPVRGSTARHKGKAGPMFQFHDGKCEITITLDLKEQTLRFSSGGHSIATLAAVKGPLYAAVTLTSPRCSATIAPGPMGKNEHTAEELVNILKAKNCLHDPRIEDALLVIPRDIFVPKDRHREAFRDQKITVRMADNSTLVMPQPSFVAIALEKLNLTPGTSFLDVGCGSGYVTAVAACLVGFTGIIHGIECLSSRLEVARSNLHMLRERLSNEPLVRFGAVLGDYHQPLSKVDLMLSNVLIPECTYGQMYDSIYCDTCLSEEDLPAFLSLLKPGGRLATMIGEELLLITRGAGGLHDYTKEVLMKVQGDMGELEDPTTWEVQEAIARIKERELRRGIGQAKAEYTARKNHEHSELQTRIQAAVSRISELEAALQQVRLARGAVVVLRDDTRSGLKDAGGDKSRRNTPRNSTKELTQQESGELNDDWSPSRGHGGDSVKARVKQLLGDGDEVLNVVQMEGAISTTVYPAEPIDNNASWQEAHVEALGIQMLTISEITSLLDKLRCIELHGGCQLYRPVTFRGTACRIWRVPLLPSTTAAEVYRAYSRFCTAHPNILPILAMCLEGPSTPRLDGDDQVDAMDTDSTMNLWIVEECGSEETLAARLERGLLSWQQVVHIARSMAQALAYLQGLRKLTRPQGLQPQGDTLNHHTVAAILMPSSVMVHEHHCKMSLVPALLTHMEVSILAATKSDMVLSTLPYINPSCLFGTVDPLDEQPLSCCYGFGVVLAQLLTEQPPPGILGAVRQSLTSNSLTHLVPRIPVGQETKVFAEALAELAVKCTTPLSEGGVLSIDMDVLPVLEDLCGRLASLGPAALSWEQIEELLMLPLQPCAPGDTAAGRRWVRQDFRLRRKLFLEEVAKMAVEGPIHKIEVRRARCFKDSVTTFNGKGQNVWRQPLKVTFVQEAGMDSGGVTREWFSSISRSLSRGNSNLFYSVGPNKDHLYVNPVSHSPSHLKKFQFVGMFMAKALLETAARSKELGPICLNLQLAEPFWKLLLGVPVNLMDLQQLDFTDFRSLMQLMSMDIEGLLFESFVWNFQLEEEPNKDEPEVPSLPATASPFAGGKGQCATHCIPLKPGGTHVKVTNANKREYMLLKARTMLVGAVELQMTALIDAFHSLIPRDLIEKYGFTSLELQLLVCGEQYVDMADLKTHCRYEDGYTGKEDQISWFWQCVENMDETQRRNLLQFWSGSDSMPANGFASVEPAFHIVAVDRLYDAKDKTARLPAAHTCFRQLDLPRYSNLEEMREKLTTAITLGQGYMALS